MKEDSGGTAASATNVKGSSFERLDEARLLNPANWGSLESSCFNSTALVRAISMRASCKAMVHSCHLVIGYAGPSCRVPYVLLLQDPYLVLDFGAGVDLTALKLSSSQSVSIIPLGIT